MATTKNRIEFSADLKELERIDGILNKLNSSFFKVGTQVKSIFGGPSVNEIKAMSTQYKTLQDKLSRIPDLLEIISMKQNSLRKEATKHNPQSAQFQQITKDLGALGSEYNRISGIGLKYREAQQKIAQQLKVDHKSQMEMEDEAQKKKQKNIDFLKYAGKAAIGAAMAYGVYKSTAPVRAAAIPGSADLFSLGGSIMGSMPLVGGLLGGTFGRMVGGLQTAAGWGAASLEASPYTSRKGLQSVLGSGLGNKYAWNPAETAQFAGQVGQTFGDVNPEMFSLFGALKRAYGVGPEVGGVFARGGAEFQPQLKRTGTVGMDLNQFPAWMREGEGTNESVGESRMEKPSMADASRMVLEQSIRDGFVSGLGKGRIGEYLQSMSQYITSNQFAKGFVSITGMSGLMAKLGKYGGEMLQGGRGMEYMGALEGMMKNPKGGGAEFIMNNIMGLYSGSSFYDVQKKKEAGLTGVGGLGGGGVEGMKQLFGGIDKYFGDKESANLFVGGQAGIPLLAVEKLREVVDALNNSEKTEEDVKKYNADVQKILKENQPLEQQAYDSMKAFRGGKDLLDAITAQTVKLAGKGDKIFSKMEQLWREEEKVVVAINNTLPALLDLSIAVLPTLLVVFMKVYELTKIAVEYNPLLIAAKNIFQLITGQDLAGNTWAQFKQWTDRANKEMNLPSRPERDSRGGFKSPLPNFTPDKTPTIPAPPQKNTASDGGGVITDAPAKALNKITQDKKPLPNGGTITTTVNVQYQPGPKVKEPAITVQPLD